MEVVEWVLESRTGWKLITNGSWVLQEVTVNFFWTFWFPHFPNPQEMFPCINSSIASDEALVWSTSLEESPPTSQMTPGSGPVPPLFQPAPPPDAPMSELLPMLPAHSGILSVTSKPLQCHYLTPILLAWLSGFAQSSIRQPQTDQSLTFLPSWLYHLSLGNQLPIQMSDPHPQCYHSDSAQGCLTKQLYLYSSSDAVGTLQLDLWG